MQSRYHLVTHSTHTLKDTHTPFNRLPSQLFINSTLSSLTTCNVSLNSFSVQNSPTQRTMNSPSIPSFPSQGHRSASHLLRSPCSPVRFKSPERLVPAPVMKHAPVGDIFREGCAISSLKLHSLRRGVTTIEYLSLSSRAPLTSVSSASFFSTAATPARGLQPFWHLHPSAPLPPPRATILALSSHDPRRLFSVAIADRMLKSLSSNSCSESFAILNEIFKSRLLRGASTSSENFYGTRNIAIRRLLEARIPQNSAALSYTTIFNYHSSISLPIAFIFLCRRKAFKLHASNCIHTSGAVFSDGKFSSEDLNSLLGLSLHDKCQHRYSRNEN